MSLNDAWKVGASIWKTGVAVQETAIAAPVVIEKRGRMMAYALSNPLDADYDELSRMAPEKLEAFGQAGASLFDDWMDLQADLLLQWHDIAGLPLSCAMLDFSALGRIGDRARRIGVRIGMAGGKAFAPVHSAATENRRRLERTSSC